MLLMMALKASDGIWAKLDNMICGGVLITSGAKFVLLKSARPYVNDSLTLASAWCLLKSSKASLCQYKINFEGRGTYNDNNWKSSHNHINSFEDIKSLKYH